MEAPSIDFAGERLTLLPHRAIHWPRARALLIADLHLGKTAAFRALGVPAPEASTAADLNRLSDALAITSAERLIVLGDLVHASAAHTHPTSSQVAEWRCRHDQLHITLVRGNHDHRAGPNPHPWRIDLTTEELLESPFTLRHDPGPRVDTHTLCGHLHPVISFRGRAKFAARLRCYCFSASLGVLPAFGSFTGGHSIRPAPDESIFVITPDGVLPLKTPLQA